MPELTIATPGPLVVNVEIGHTIREATVLAHPTIGPDYVSVTIGTTDVGARLIGHRDIIAGLLDDALQAVTGRRTDGTSR